MTRWRLRTGRRSFPSGRMNGLEREYAAVLELRLAAREILEYDYEAIKLRISKPGGRCWYTPDFLVVLADGTIELHEVKGGHIEDDSIVKLRAAARLYPRIVWRLVQKKRGTWSESEL